MAIVKLGEKEIAGERTEIYADPIGRFYIERPREEDGKRVETLGSGMTLDNAVADARKSIAKGRVKVQVPFITFAGERGYAVGRHAGNRDILVRLGPNDEADRFSSTTSVFRTEVAGEVLSRYLDLDAQSREISREMAQIRKEYEMRLATEVNKAVEQAAEKVLVTS